MKFTLSQKMIDALGMTIHFEKPSRNIMIHSSPRTQAALAARGLATEHGRLTVEGEYLAFLYRAAPTTTPKTWNVDAVRVGAKVWYERNH
jgi:hypothetical protein